MTMRSEWPAFAARLTSDFNLARYPPYSRFKLASGSFQMNR